MSWITPLRAPAVKALAEAGALQLRLFDEADLAEIAHPDFPGERLVACRNPALAAERTRKRSELLDATEADLAKVAAAVTRERRPLRGQDKIALRVATRIVNAHKMAKNFELSVTDSTLVFAPKATEIATEAALDGIYVVRTCVPGREGSTPAVWSRSTRASRSSRRTSPASRPSTWTCARCITTSKTPSELMCSSAACRLRHLAPPPSVGTDLVHRRSASRPHRPRRPRSLV